MRCLIGIPCGETLKTAMGESLARLNRARVVGGWDVELFAFCSGPYVHLNLIELLRAFLATNAGAFLRIDTDMAWTPAWAEHFFRSLQMEYFSEDGANTPFLHGGVYPRRREIQNFEPCLQYGESMPADEYAQRIRSDYAAGATRQVRRVGGGWCVYNRAAARMPPESFGVRPGIGEDYGSCDTAYQRCGEVLATFPLAGADCELSHIEGSTLIGLSHYLRRAAGGDGFAGVAPAERS